MRVTYTLTIVVPVYNEQDNMIRLEKELAAYCQKSKHNVKILFVNDGSTDSSQTHIEQMCQRNEPFSFIKFQNNCGLSAAIKAGIDHVTTPFVGYIDSDLQTDPNDFDLLMEHANDFDLVTGIRANRKDTIVKNLSSKIANSIRRSVTHDGVEDTGCPLKVINSTAAKKIPFFTGMHRFLPALIILQNGTIKQVPVSHFPRIAGEAKYHLWNRLFGPLMDLFAFKWMKKRYINYDVEKTG
ncbi:glycosyltransferase family 2 protein [Prolixibacteraceae bacterium JC049]|nr:glycosyltransferase family 2 protein [Prolixibacteraceae bacterium JC049]